MPSRDRAGIEPKTNDGSGQPDHEGGIIRRNAVCNLNPWADEGIEVNASPGARVEHNTVLVEGKVPWSISIRFPTASARVWNNLSNRQIILRDGAKADLKANVGNAQRNWFIDAKRGDLRLARPDLPGNRRRRGRRRPREECRGSPLFQRIGTRCRGF